MATQSSKSGSKKQELIDALRMARDTARVQAHLFSLDAKERWQELEGRLVYAESKLVQGTDSILDGVSASVDELVRTARDILNGIDDALDISAPVGDVMTKDPRTCSPDDSLGRAAQIMWEADCGAVPVVNADGGLAGIITDRDICMATFTRGKDPFSLDVKSTMATNVHCASPSDAVGHVARSMGEHRVHRVPVVNESGRLVGIVSLADFARYVSQGKKDDLPACVTLAHALGRISERRDPSADKAAAE